MASLRLRMVSLSGAIPVLDAAPSVSALAVALAAAQLVVARGSCRPRPR